MKYLSQKSYITIVILMLPFSIFLQFFLNPNLPSKYFYDSQGILSITNGTANLFYFDASYQFAGNFFKLINIFNFKTFQDWALFITFITSPIIITELLKCKKVSIANSAFIIVTIVFLNIYILRISKDYIQFLIWTLIYYTLRIKEHNKTKTIITFIIFLLEAIYFRSYYIIIGLLFIFIYKYLSSESKKDIKIGKILLIVAISITLSLFALQKISPFAYDQIINMRYYQNSFRENSGDANTAINDLIKSKSPIFYCANYVINLVRILFPIELIMKGIKYIPFIIYQIYFSINIMKRLKGINKNNIFNISILLSYLLVSNLFEPDFGSVIRHEVALFFILIDIILGDKKNEKQTTKN